MGRLLTNEEFLEKARKIHGDKFDYSKTKYINASTNIIIICKIHGEFLQTPTKHTTISKKYKAQGCPKCSGRRTQEEFIAKCNEIHNNKFDYSKVIFTNCYNKITIICPKHGEFSQRARAHLDKQGCPTCRESQGEKEISKILEKLNLKYIREFKFENCKRKSQLPFDFKVFYKNSFFLIEYNGKQHYQESNYSNWGHAEKLKDIQERDLIKKKYCKNNKFPLLIISYKKLNKIEEILKEWIHKL